MTDPIKALAAVEPVVLDLEDACLEIEESMSADDRQTRAQYQRGCAALRSLVGEVERLREALAIVEHDARPTSPPVYPEMVNGQNVKQPTPSILVEIAPSGFAERIIYGQIQWDSSRVVKYVLAPPELPSTLPTGASDG